MRRKKQTKQSKQRRRHFRPEDSGNPRKRLLNWYDLRNLKGIAFSRAHIYRLISEGKFPRPVHVGEARVAFLEEEIDKYLEKRIALRDQVA